MRIRDAPRRPNQVIVHGMRFPPRLLDEIRSRLSVSQVVSRTVPFASAFYLLKPDFPIGVEVMKFNGAARKPLLINMKLGRFLKLNFDLALLMYQGGYDLLGVFQFRYNHFPKK